MVSIFVGCILPISKHDENWRVSVALENKGTCTINILKIYAVLKIKKHAINEQADVSKEKFDGDGFV